MSRLANNIKQIFIKLWRGKENCRNNTKHPNKLKALRQATPIYRNKYGYPISSEPPEPPR